MKLRRRLREFEYHHEVLVPVIGVVCALGRDATATDALARCVQAAENLGHTFRAGDVQRWISEAWNIDHA